MYRSGTEQKIRKYLVDNNYIDCVIQLPSNLFFGTPIATCIMVLKKGKKDNDILFIDATNECIKITNNNKLTKGNIDTIVDFYKNRVDVEHKVCKASYDTIVENAYNLAVSIYVESEDFSEDIDIDELNQELESIVNRESKLRETIDAIVSEIEVVKWDE